MKTGPFEYYYAAEPQIEYTVEQYNRHIECYLGGFMQAQGFTAEDAKRLSPDACVVLLNAIMTSRPTSGDIQYLLEVSEAEFAAQEANRRETLASELATIVHIEQLALFETNFTESAVVA